VIIGCFALIDPLRPMRSQFDRIREMGFEYADLTDNHDGGMLGVEYGFAESISLDIHPADVRAMVEGARLTLTAVCAHANLLDPTSPARYGTAQIIKAVRLAHHLGIRQVITTEGAPATDFGRRLSRDQRVFSVVEKLQEPLRWARELGVELLIEPHGAVTDTIDGMEAILEALGDERHVGVNLDTGNAWLGGTDPLEYVRAFGRRIRHVHWKDLGDEWLPRRGTVFGCGMGTIPLGGGLVGIRQVVDALLDMGFDGPTTLEVAGADNIRRSADQLRVWSN